MFRVSFCLAIALTLCLLGTVACSDNAPGETSSPSVIQGAAPTSAEATEPSPSPTYTAAPTSAPTLIFPTSPPTLEPPPKGDPVPGMEVFDNRIPVLMEEFHIPGGAIAVVKDGRLVLARGYGLADVEWGEPVQSDSLFRIAGVSKPITAVAVLKLVEEGRLDLEARAFQILDQFQVPEGSTTDPRIFDVTVRQLLQHSGGWDRESFDAMWIPSRVEMELGIQKPVSCKDVIRFMLGQPLDFDPGTRHAYSNFGYCLLGRIIEETTGQSYEEYVKSQIFGPVGITRMRIGGTLLEDRVDGEVRYYGYPGQPWAQSVVTGTPEHVPWPYGGYYVAGRDSLGGWIASPIDLVRFVAALDGSRNPQILEPETVRLMVSRPAPPLGEGRTYHGMGWSVRPVGDDADWMKIGIQPGVWSVVVRTHNGLAWAALFNSWPKEPAQFRGELSSLMWDGVRAVTTWPSHDLFPQYEFE